MAHVHATAIVDGGAELAADVHVGPFAVVGADVVVGPGCRIASHAVLMGPLTMGPRNEVHSFAVLGGPPQSKRHQGEATRVEIGSDNVFREHVTVHRGTRDSFTSIGSSNLFMAQAHVAHDVRIGSHCVVANAVQLAGHVIVEDWVTFGGLAGVAQFARIGEGAFVAAGAMVERGIPPFCIAQGDRARVRAINRVGLLRREVPKASIVEIERIFRLVFRSKITRREAIASVQTTDEWAAKLALWLRLSLAE
jgi:UDP-N-acetylglucosamine acyltransferase